MSTSERQTSETDAAEVSIDIAAGLDRVWDALVTDGGLEPWMGRGATIDPRPDGTLEVPDVVGGEVRHGLVHTVDAGDRLGFTWWPAHRPNERSDVSITLTPTEDGTRVTVVEVPVTSSHKSNAMASANGFSPASGSASGAHALAHTGSLRGCWSWRLAVLALASQMVRI